MRDQQLFVQVFERIMKAPPPFPISRPYKVLATTEIDHLQCETMIGSPDGSPLLVQAQVDRVRGTQPGWFQAGFWGHGANSYAVYYGRATERYRLYLRLPYGEGAYCSDPERERGHALAKLDKYVRLVETLPVEHAVLIDSMGVAQYELARLDGRVVRSERELFSLDWVDLVALATE